MERGNVLLSQAIKKQTTGYLEDADYLSRNVKGGDDSDATQRRQKSLVEAGISSISKGEVEQAEKYFLEALAENPDNAEAHYRLGRLYADSGRSNDAIVHFQLALRSRTDHYLTYACLGKALVEKSDYNGAVSVYEAALKLRPDIAETYFNLSYSLRKAGRNEEALEMVTRGLEIDPQSTLGHNRRGLICQDLRDYEAAEESYKTALRIAPDFIDALCNLGIVYRKKEKYDDAFSVLEKALSLNPLHVESLNNLGLLYRDMGDCERAYDLYLKSLRADPDYIEAVRNLSEICYEMAAYDQALKYAEQALKVDPDNHEVRWNRSHSLLAAGRLEEGWKEYENRRFLDDCSIRSFPYKTWDGSPLAGRTILIHAEQGLGDEILFASCYQDVIQAAEKCIIDCDPRLVGLFERSFPGAIVVGGRPHVRTDLIERHGPVDFEIASGSLMRYFRSALEHFPHRNDFLCPDPERYREFFTRIQALGSGLKVGICWRSGKRNTQRNRFYMEIEQWLPILSMADVQFVNLQYGDCSEELEKVMKTGQVKVHHYDDLDMYNDIEGVCALIASLDLVISANTVVVSLAAALGKPVWCLSAPAWTRMGTDYQPAYPTLRPFYKSYQESWDETITEVASALSAVIQESLGRDESCDNSECLPFAKGAVERQLVLQQTYEGLLLFDEAAGKEGRSLKQYGEYAVNEIPVLQPILKKGGIVVDVGTGVGLNTLRLARLVGTEGKVISFEKDRLIFQNLCANLALNQVENVHASLVEVGDSGEGRISIDELGLDACDLICIGQRADPGAVLKGGKATIQRYKPFIYIRETGEDMQRLIQSEMEALGYMLVCYGIALYRPDNFLGDTVDIFNGQDIQGILCIPSLPGDD